MNTKSTKRYWVTGGSGRLGRLITPLLQCDVPSHAEVDILRPERLDSFAARGVYAAVIHLAAMAEAARAEKQPREAYLLNVIGTRNVAQTAARHDLKIFYVSTDYVFEGVKGDYREEDIPHPANWYGATKYAGELEIGESGCAYA